MGCSKMGDDEDNAWDMWRQGRVLTQQVSRDGSPEVDVSVPVALVQLAADVGMEVQIEGLYLMEEVLQILH